MKEKCFSLFILCILTKHNQYWCFSQANNNDDKKNKKNKK